MGGQSCCHLEHLTGSFAVRGSNDWGVHVQEASLLEELVGGVGQVVSHASHRRDKLGAWSEVGDISKILVGVSLLCEGIG